jgi:hypothetical protein
MKRIYLNVFAVLVVVFCFIGCSSKRKELAENTTKSFFSAIKNDNKSELKELYPDFENIGTYYKSDEISVKEIKLLEDNKISVSVENSFTNGYGKKFNQTITLYLKPEENNKDVYKIYDSKGLTGYEEKDEYIFAIKTGVINKNENLTDQEIAEKLEIANKMIVKYGIETLSELKANIKVTSWSWESGYGGSASGKGIVKNNSDFSVPNLKYKITYYDRSDNQITTDNGYVTHDKLSAGDSKSFTFYTSYVGNAYTATISLDFDTEMIIKYVVNQDYTGNEYNEYLKSE